MKFLYRNKLLLFVAVLVGVVISVKSLNDLTDDMTRNTALLEMRNYSKALTSFRSVYTSEVIKNLENTCISVTHDYQNQENAVPLPATLSMRLGREITNAGSETLVDLYSPYPFKFRAQEEREMDAFEKAAWEHLSSTPETPYYEFEEDEGEVFIRYAVADILRPSCVNCHNTHPDSPKRDWKVGDLRGVLQIRNHVEQNQNWGSMLVLMRIGGILLPFIVCVLGLLVVVGNLNESRVKLSQREKELSFKSAELENKVTDLNEFSQAMAHDLKTPIMGIHRLIDFLESDLQQKVGGEERRMLDMIKDNAGRSFEMLEAINAYIHLTSIEESSSSFRLNSLIDQIVDELPDYKDVQVVYPEKDLLIKGCEPLYQRVLKELLSNALYHSGKEGSELKVEIDCWEVENGYRLSVKDNGEGFSPRFSEYILQPLKTLKPKGKTRRIGMGLAIINKLVRLNKGIVEVYPKEDEGLKVVVQFPYSA